LETDIGDEHNLVAQYSVKAKSLMQQLGQSAESEKAQFPTDEKTGELMYPGL
jgi:hypothetical protein